ncbi:MAG: hypothetical protein AAFV53_25550 [Myxococcota bacterium]
MPRKPKKWEYNSGLIGTVHDGEDYPHEVELDVLDPGEIDPNAWRFVPELMRCWSDFLQGETDWEGTCTFETFEEEESE